MSKKVTSGSWKGDQKPNKGKPDKPGGGLKNSGRIGVPTSSHSGTKLNIQPDLQSS